MACGIVTDPTPRSSFLLYTLRDRLSRQYFDIILTHSKLDQSCYELAAFVDAYVKDIKRTPIIDATLLHTAKSGEEDEDLASPVPSPQAGAAPHLNYLD